MEDYRGEFQRRYGHPDIIVPAGAAYRAGAEWILSDLEGQIRSGAVFRAGQTIQVGWMTLLLSVNKSGELEVLEPEFGSVPVKWVRSANNTIRDLTVQKEVCDQAKVEAAHPSMRQSAVISPKFMEDHREFELSRDAPNGNDSGWVFRDRAYSSSNGALCSLYQVAIAVPAIIPFLALPPETIVRRRNGGLEVSATRSQISAADNEFLARLVGSIYFGG